ncbi:MAG: PAS domain-containing protein [Planctomycetes bacterium]|nr:PAS domain-containing protein [Planctomycetota bacterium]
MNLKYPIWIFIVVLMLLSICCAMAGLMPMTALVYLGVLGGIAAAGLGFLCWRTLKELGELTRSLSTEKPSVAADVVLLKPLVTVLNTALQKLSEPIQTVRQDNQDLNLQLQLLRRRKNGVETILNSIQDAVLVADSQDRLILANPSAEKLFNFKFDSSRLPILSDAIDQSALLDMMLKARNSRVCHVRHELTIKADGENISFDCVLSCVTDDAGRPVSVVAILHDVTREKEISRAKNEFVSHVSHELKTPLASINAYAEMLVDGEAQDAATIRQFCEIIQGQAGRLNRLIEDVLNISRIESGLMKINRQTNSMALILRDSLEMMQSYAKEKNITIHTPPSILFDQVYVDKDMMTQVVVNLLSNAVKYTPSGGQVTVQIEVNDVEGTITVSVTDTGIGIPEQEMSKLFGKFYRVEANKNFAKGTGLGLNLVKQIVETVHGGQVFVRSQQGKGSTFGFVLPLAAAGQPAV